MIDDQLVEFEVKSKEGLSNWQILLENADIFPIGLYILVWFSLKVQYSEQLFQEDDMTYLGILAFPVFFWWLYSRHIKFGWFLRSTFYLLVSTIIIREFFTRSNFDVAASIVFMLLLIVSSTIVVNSFRKVHLRRLKIDSIILTFTLIVDIGIILAIALI